MLTSCARHLVCVSKLLLFSFFFPLIFFLKNFLPLDDSSSQYVPKWFLVCVANRRNLPFPLTQNKEKTLPTPPRPVGAFSSPFPLSLLTSTRIKSWTRLEETEGKQTSSQLEVSRLAGVYACCVCVFVGYFLCVQVPDSHTEKITYSQLDKTLTIFFLCFLHSFT